jgi:hypothetical protein
MQTDTVAACYIENNDHIVIDGKVVGYVYIINEDAEDPDRLLIDVVDEEGDHTEYPFAPFDPVSFVTAFDDENVDESAFDLD